MSSLLAFQQVTKQYGSKKALQSLSFRIEPGKIIGLLGVNGSGKSTLMKLAAGLAHPDTGTVQVAGLPVSRETKALVSFMPDRPVVDDWMRVKDAVAFYRDFFADFDTAKAADMLDFMQLQPQDRVTSLSKGMQERLNLTLALSRNAKLYLLDEPIGGVDPIARDKILDAIVEYYSEDSSILITTHLHTDIEKIFDEVIIIQDGMLRLQEDVESIRLSKGKSVSELFKEVCAQ